MVKQNYGQNWTKLLADIDLESPGFAEAVKATAEKTAERKRREAAGLAKKSKSKKRK